MSIGPISPYDAYKLASPHEDEPEPRDEPLGTMPFGGLLASLNHDSDCDCEWCDEQKGLVEYFNEREPRDEGDLADEAHELEEDR